MLTDKLLDVAQRIMDSYYQDFAPADAFFKLEDFAFWLGSVYAKDCDDTAQAIYKLSLAEQGMGYITFTQDWWKSKEFEVKKTDGQYYIDLDIKYIGFTYDTQNSGIQFLAPTEYRKNCGNFIRTTLTELWILNHTTASSNVWWYIDGNKIFFKVSGNANPTKVKVFYIPTAEDENFDIPKSREFVIATQAWAYLTQAKQGILIDTTNDQNSNKIPQTETNLAQLQPLRK